jgi:peptidoglycan-N-acetylglucosamine deacetylase
MTTRRSALAALAAAGVATVGGCGTEPRRARFAQPAPGPSSTRPDPAPTLSAPAHPASRQVHRGSPTTAPPPSHPAVPHPRRPEVGGGGPAGSIMTTRSSGIALTFDDGPDAVNTPKLLDILGEHDVKATFNLVGFRARDVAPVVRRIADEGHTLANHSWQHLMDLGKRPEAFIRGDLTGTNNAINRAAPHTQVRFFRAPGGNFTPRLVDLSRELGMTPVYWTVDPQDWNSARFGHGPSMVTHIVSEVKAHVRPGRIVLSHDCKHPDTIAAYAILVPWLKAHYRIVGLPG